MNQSAVIGVPDPTKGEVVHAFPVSKSEARDKATGEEIAAWRRENMSYYKVPRSIEFRDSLPATGAGKMPRRLLEMN